MHHHIPHLAHLSYPVSFCVFASTGRSVCEVITEDLPVMLHDLSIMNDVKILIASPRLPVALVDSIIDLLSDRLRHSVEPPLLPIRVVLFSKSRNDEGLQASLDAINKAAPLFVLIRLPRTHPVVESLRIE